VCGLILYDAYPAAVWTPPGAELPEQEGSVNSDAGALPFAEVTAKEKLRKRIEAFSEEEAGEALRLSICA
jgi:hypothetical protein